jgi:tellurite methyltransferase
MADMERAMQGFHQDAEGHWVAELVCGHTQHVRHQPPFTLRPWVMTAEGRAGRLGQSLECPACDRQEMPAGYAPYRRTPAFTQASVPQGLLHQHQTKAGVWALVHVSSGSLEFYERAGSGETRREVAAGQTATIRPNVEHRVAPLGEVEFCVEFWRAAPAG